jgi:hypothetical protein
VNKYRLIARSHLPQVLKLRLRRWLLERDLERDTKSMSASDRVEWDGGSYSFDFGELEEDETRFHSNALMQRARRLRLPVPPVFEGSSLSDNWQRSNVDGRIYFLSMSGEQRLRQAIRDEEKYRAEKRARLIPYMSAISGLVGTLTGLAAVLQKWWL